MTDTQAALAALAGSSRENVNRYLRKWQQDGLVAITDRRISLLDTEGLARVVGSFKAD